MNVWALRLVNIEPSSFDRGLDHLARNGMKDAQVCTTHVEYLNLAML
jgi:hypothetical protein